MFYEFNTLKTYKSNHTNWLKFDSFSKKLQQECLQSRQIIKIKKQQK